MTNPRWKNGTLRRKYRQRFKAQGAPCGICGGRLGAIHYDEPSDSKHPLSKLYFTGKQQGRSHKENNCF